MLINYLKSSIRNLLRSRLYSLINILGLTLGIACCTLLAMYIMDELRFDDMHTKSENMSRVIISDNSYQEGTRYFGQTAAPIGPALVETFPEIETSVRLWQFVGHLTFLYDGQRFAERGWYMAEENFFDHFNFKFKTGDPETALSQPNTIVISEATANKYFGNEDPIGQLLEESLLGELQVTGVIENIPQNSHLQFDVLVSISRNDENWQEYLTRFDQFGTFTYLVTSPDTDLKDLNSKFPEFLNSNLGDNAEGIGMYLQPLEDIHFNSSNIEFGTDQIKGDIKYIYIFLAVGMFILLIASINYMNLATAKSMERSKEIGIRKVAGAHRGQLIIQFLSESILTAFFSLLLSIGLVDLLMPFFNEISGKSFDLNFNTFPRIAGILLIITTLVGFLSGIYPALFLSKFRPASILSGELVKGRKGGHFRKILVVTQFGLSIFMIVATLIVNRQLNYIRHFDLGFDEERMVIVDINNGNVRSNFETMKVEFTKVPGVTNVAASSRVPGEWKDITEIVTQNVNREDSIRAYYMAFDEDMVDTYGFELLEGRNFEGIPSSDSTKVVLNESAARSLGLHEDPIGKIISINSVPNIRFEVIGILKDFNYQSLHQSISPLVIGYWNAPIRVIDYFSIKITGKQIPETIRGLTNVHETFDDSTPIEYHFLDNQIGLFYQKEERAGKIFIFGAGLTIFIACLGLFGLASFIIQKKTKEIGIRRVMGASIANLYFLISFSFIRQVIIAWILAIPISYIVMNKWLSIFNFHTSMPIDVYVIAGAIALTIALITVSYRAIRASLMNPSDTLRYE